MKQQLTKYLASHGPWSRRQAESLIRAGRVTVDDQPAHLGEIIINPHTIIKVDGHPIANQEPAPVYLMVNKPVGYTCTNKQLPHEKNIFELVNYPGRLFVAGRLDKNSHGLVLLTNDGILAAKLTHPRFTHPKIYEVTVRPGITSASFIKLQTFLSQGHKLYDGQSLARAKISRQLASDRLEIILEQGQKRQIRLLLKLAGYEVIDLKRTGLGPLKLGRLPIGAVRSLNTAEIDRLKQLIQDKQ